jgi:hypothetical protein
MRKKGQTTITIENSRQTTLEEFGFTFGDEEE